MHKDNKNIRNEGDYFIQNKKVQNWKEDDT